ncbi:MAG: DUF1501 domain-containing protein [Pseudomonadales bacterium]
MAFSRRRFIGHGAAVMAAAGTQLGLVSRAAHAGPGDEYRALVCVLLAGGADSYNMLVPYDSDGYADYSAIRSDLALPRDQLIELPGNGSRRFALHPALAPLAAHYGAGDLALVTNVGTLVEPTDPDAVAQGSARLPLGLFSHADQIAQWQTSLPDLRSGSGVGGRLADLVAAGRGVAPISMNISLSGTNVFQTGATVSSYSVDADEGVRQVAGYDPQDPDSALFTSALDALLAAPYADPFRASYATQLRQAIDAGRSFRDALAAAPPLATAFQADPFSSSLAQIARIISVRDQLDAGCQTFFVTFGGWDHHDDVLENQAAMLPALAAGLDSLQRALVELGVADRVTTFTISDFGRTLTSNGKGSDHGWGGHQLVLGGSVAGGALYGEYPELVADNPLDVGRGRYIPTTSVDEFYADLALWFGVAEADLPLVLPNLSRFRSAGGGPPLGLMV